MSIYVIYVNIKIKFTIFLVLRDQFTRALFLVRLKLQMLTHEHDKICIRETGVIKL